MDETEQGQRRRKRERVLAKMRELTATLKAHDDNFRRLVDAWQAKLDAVMEKLEVIAKKGELPSAPQVGDKAAD